MKQLQKGQKTWTQIWKCVRRVSCVTCPLCAWWQRTSAKNKKKQFVGGNNLFVEKFVESCSHVLTQRSVETIQFLFLKLFPRFFTYGDLPLEQHLKQIEEEALSKFERINPNTEVPAQPRWRSPVGPSSRHITTKNTKNQHTLTSVLLPPHLVWFFRKKL